MAAAIAVAAALVIGCAGGSTPQGVPPTETEARAVLAELVAAARAGEFGTLCARGDANCPDVLAEAGRGRVPPEPPVLAGTRLLEPEPNRDGGLVLQVCGIDGAGRRYASELLVTRTVSGLRVIQPVYWSGLRVPDDATVGTDRPLGWPGCP